MDPIFDRLGRLIRSSAAISARGNALRSTLWNVKPRKSSRNFCGQGATLRSAQRAKAAVRFTSKDGRRRTRPSPEVAQALIVLGLPSTATWDQINAAHRTLLKEHHPDRHAGNETLIKAATDQSQKINEAYQVLKKHLGR